MTKLLRKEDEDGIAEPLAGTASFWLLPPVTEDEEEENPRPCLNLAAPPLLRVSSS